MKSVRGKVVIHNVRAASRTCTDTRWIVLLLIGWIFLATLGTLAVTHGNYLTLIKGFDSFGNLCGERDNQPYKNVTLSGTDTSSKPNLLYLGYGNLSNVLTLCVEKCNNKTMHRMKDIYEFYKFNKTSFCRYDFNYSLLENDTKIDEFSNIYGPCPRLRIEESTSLKNRCIPNVHEYIFSSGTYKHLNLGFGKVQLFFSYIYVTWKYIVALGCFGLYVVGVLLCIIWLQGQMHPSFMGFLCFTTCVVLSSELCYIYFRLPTEFGDYMKSTELGFRKFLTFMEDFQINEVALYAFHGICLIVTEALTMVLILTRKYIDSSAIVLREAVKCCKEVPQLMYISLISSVILGGCFSLWSYLILCSSAASKRTIVPFELKKASLGNEQLIHMRQLERVIFADIRAIHNSTWILTFGFMWTAEFILACNQFCLETLATQWFWKAPSKPTILSIIRVLIRYHLGSAARRSFLALFKIPRMTLIFLCQRLRDCCSSCRIGAKLETFERFISPPFHHVYGFEVETRRDPHFLIRSVESLIMEAKREKLDGIRCVVSCTFIAAKVTVVNATSLLGIFLMHDQEDLYLYMCPVILSSILALYIADIGLAAIETPLATILFCILESRPVSVNRKRKAEKFPQVEGVIMVVDQISEEDGRPERFIPKSQNMEEERK